jgi:hypothetical protein
LFAASIKVDDHPTLEKLVKYLEAEKKRLQTLNSSKSTNEKACKDIESRIDAIMNQIKEETIYLNQQGQEKILLQQNMQG